jgi:DNA-binding XRE family transcriptional regulator
MSDLQRYIDKRLSVDSEFADGFETGYKDFKLGVLLQQTREEMGLTQEQVAKHLGITLMLIAQIETEAEEVRLSLLQKYAGFLGKNIQIQLISA